jgi:hypothetical protein
MQIVHFVFNLIGPMIKLEVNGGNVCLGEDRQSVEVEIRKSHQQVKYKFDKRNKMVRVNEWRDGKSEENEEKSIPLKEVQLILLKDEWRNHSLGYLEMETFFRNIGLSRDQLKIQGTDLFVDLENLTL